MTCWRRLREWQATGVWHQLHLILLAELRSAGRLDFSHASIDGSSVLAPGGPAHGSNLTDRAGIPLAFCVTGANRHDSVVFEEFIDGLPAVRALLGRPRRWFERLHAYKGYDFHRCREHLKRRGIQDRRRGIERNDRLGRHTWVLERTNALLAAFSALCVRFKRSVQTHLAFLSLA